MRRNGIRRVAFCLQSFDAEAGLVMHLQYDFEGRKDLVKFVKTVAEAGLLVHLRIGPYVCAEWNYG